MIPDRALSITLHRFQRDVLHIQTYDVLATNELVGMLSYELMHSLHNSPGSVQKTCVVKDAHEVKRNLWKSRTA